MQTSEVLVLHTLIALARQMLHHHACMHEQA